MTELDDIDRRIISELQRDGRLAIVDLADRVGLSATPCLRRVKRLEAEGLIRRYAALVDPKALGLGTQALVQVTLDDHSEPVVEAFEAAIRQRPEVIACHAVTGEMDFLLQIQVADLEAFSAFALKALLRMPGVRGTKSSFIMQTIKSDLAWAPAPTAPPGRRDAVPARGRSAPSRRA
jgi:Lrp/AsnC family transcriptional regulator, leucine-responsive regulatory protein